MTAMSFYEEPRTDGDDMAWEYECHKCGTVPTRYELRIGYCRGCADARRDERARQAENTAKGKVNE